MKLTDSEINGKALEMARYYVDKKLPGGAKSLDNNQALNLVAHGAAMAIKWVYAQHEPTKLEEQLTVAVAALQEIDRDGEAGHSEARGALQDIAKVGKDI